MTNFEFQWMSTLNRLNRWLPRCEKFRGYHFSSKSSFFWGLLPWSARFFRGHPGTEAAAVTYATRALCSIVSWRKWLSCGASCGWSWKLVSAMLSFDKCSTTRASVPICLFLFFHVFFLQKFRTRTHSKKSIDIEWSQETTQAPCQFGIPCRSAISSRWWGLVWHGLRHAHFLDLHAS